MRTKFLLILNTINAILFIVVISLFLKKHIGVIDGGPIDIIATNITTIHDDSLGKTLDEIIKKEQVRVEEQEKKIEVVDVTYPEINEEKISDSSKGLALNDVIKENTSFVEELKEITDIKEIDMNNHSMDLFNKKLLVNQKNNIPLKLSLDKDSQKKLKPNTEVLVSSVNYGMYAKVVHNKKIYLLDKKYLQ